MSYEFFSHINFTFWRRKSFSQTFFIIFLQYLRHVNLHIFFRLKLFFFEAVPANRTGQIYFTPNIKTIMMEYMQAKCFSYLIISLEIK